jgi:hypothetical protein
MPTPIPEMPDEVDTRTITEAGCLGPDGQRHRVRRHRPVRVPDSQVPPDTWEPPEPVTGPPIQIELDALRRYQTHGDS